MNEVYKINFSCFQWRNKICRKYVNLGFIGQLQNVHCLFFFKNREINTKKEEPPTKREGHMEKIYVIF